MRLIVDGNAFINVAISVTKNVTSRDQRVGDTYYVNDLFSENGYILKEAVRVSFRNFCFTYLNSLIAPLSSSVSSVHVVFDSKSWRKEYVSNFFKTEETKISEFTYKGTRRYEEMHYLFFDYFQKVLTPILNEKCGINVYRFEGTEGDDIIAHLCETSEEDTIIYSVDQDLKQLVTGNGKNVVLILPKQTHKFKRLISPHKLFKRATGSSEVDDFFSLDDSFDSSSPMEKLTKALKEKGYVEQKIEPHHEFLTKILLGDKSDNIPKLVGMSPAKATKVIFALSYEFGDSLIHKLDSLDEETILFCVDQIGIVTKTSDEVQLNQIREHLIFNIKLMRLATCVFPESIRTTLTDFFSNYTPLRFNRVEFQELKKNQVIL
jgi:5'-3' exonuclease